MSGGTPSSGRSRWLVVVLAAMSLGPLVVLDAAALRLSGDAARKQAERQVASAAAASAVAVQREMGGLVDLVEAFTRRASLVDALDDGPDAVDRERVRAEVGQLQNSRTGIDLVFVADASGRLVDIVPETPELIGRDFSFRDWYRGVTATRGPHVSEVYETAAEGGGRVVAAAAPIRSAAGPDGPWLGILVAGYRISRVQRFVDDFAAAQGVSLTVADQRGVAMAAPDAGPGNPEATTPDAGLAAALAGRSGTGSATRDGTEVITAHTAVPGLGWAVVADLPAHVALEEVRGLRTAILALTGGLALVLVAGLLALDRALRRRSAVEAELRASQQFLDSVVENIPNMVFVKDARDLSYVRLNRAGEELLGRRREDVVGRRDEEIFPPDEAASYASKDREVLDGRMLVDIPAEPLRTSDGERVVHTRKIPILGADGTPRYLLGISEDVTERRRAVADLEVAREAADRANRAKDEFLSRMSHELRTPMNAVLGFAQLLRLDDLRPDQRESVDLIVRAGAHLLELIDDVLDVSRVETGELRLSLEPVAVVDVVAEAAGMVRPLAAGRGVRLVEGVAGCGERHVRADRQRLRQVVVNLLVNAVKYNRDGGEVAVRCERGAPGRLRLVVADTGIGLTPEDVARLFQPFERLGAEKTSIEGTGLGLVLSRHLVEAMGGAITVTSEPGVGSAFYVELPLAEEPARSSPAAGPPALPPAPAGEPRTVLYVEDNLSNVKLVERVLARRPEVRLLVAMQGSLALELAREHRPSLVLLDVHLPDMSGEEILRRLRADPRTAATPVAVLSAAATAGRVDRLRAHGVVDYLTKPLDVARLLALVDGSGGPGGPATPGPAAARPGEEGELLDSATLAQLDQLAADAARGRPGLRQAVSTFLDEGETRLASLRAAVEHGDAGGVERLAHSLAGSSASFGARRLADDCRALEERAGAGELGEATSLVVRLEEDFALAAAALRDRFLEDDGAGAPA